MSAKKKEQYSDENTAIFIPLKMQRRAEIIEFQSDDVSTKYDLVNIVRTRSNHFKFDKSMFKIYSRGKEIYSNKFLKEELQNLIGDNEKNYKNIKSGKDERRSKLARVAVILKKSDHENDKFELHLKPNKAQATKSNMVKQFDVEIPTETQKRIERYYGGHKFNIDDNVWIGDMNKQMTLTQKLLSKEALWDLSYKYFHIRNDAKAWVMYKGNDIIIKSLMMTIAGSIEKFGYGNWKPSQNFIELVLSRIDMAANIAHDEIEIANKNHSLLKLVTEGFIPKENLSDYAYILTAILPAWRLMIPAGKEVMKKIKERILLNMLMEFLVRVIVYDLNDDSSSLADKIKNEPDKIDLHYLESINKKGFVLAVYSLLLFDFVAERETDQPITEHEVENLQKIIKSFQDIISNESDDQREIDRSDCRVDTEF